MARTDHQPRKILHRVKSHSGVQHQEPWGSHFMLVKPGGVSTVRESPLTSDPIRLPSPGGCRAVSLVCLNTTLLQPTGSARMKPPASTSFSNRKTWPPYDCRARAQDRSDKSSSLTTTAAIAWHTINGPASSAPYIPIFIPKTEALLQLMFPCKRKLTVAHGYRAVRCACIIPPPCHTLIQRLKL